MAEWANSSKVIASIYKNIYVEKKVIIFNRKLIVKVSFVTEIERFWGFCNAYLVEHYSLALSN